VIVDLHYVDSPYKNQQTVTSFWTTVAPMFKDYSNVIYEPFNEPSVQDTWATYKPTMQAWVLRVGPREEGGFVKDWLYTNRNVKSPVTF
jgi:hypothetical protein